MKQVAGPKSPPRRAFAVFLTLLQVHSVFAQSSELSSRSQAAKTATTAIVTTMKNRWFEFAYECDGKTSSEKNFKESAWGIISYRDNGLYCYFHEQRVYEGPEPVVLAQHEIVISGQLSVYSFMRPHFDHGVEYALADKLGRTFSPSVRSDYDTLRSFERFFGRYVADEFSQPKIDQQGQFTIEYSRSFHRQTAVELRKPETQFRLFFDVGNDLPILTRIDRTDVDGKTETISEIRVAYDGRPESLFVARLMQNSSTELSRAFRKEYVLRETNRPEWYSEPVRIGIVPNQSVYFDRKTRTWEKQFPDILADSIIAMKPSEFNAVKEQRIARIEQIKEDPPKAVEFVQIVPAIMPVAELPPFPWLSWMIGAFAICGLIAIVFWSTTWRNLQAKSLGSERTSAE